MSHSDLMGTLEINLQKLVPYSIHCHPHHVVTWPNCTENIWTSVHTSECWIWVQYLCEAYYQESPAITQEPPDSPERPYRKKIYQEQYVTFAYYCAILCYLCLSSFIMATVRSVWFYLFLFYFSSIFYSALAFAQG